MHIHHERWQVPIEPDPLDRLYPPDAPLPSRPPRMAPGNMGLEPPNQFAAALWDGVMWIGGAIALRLGVNALLAQSASFWLPSILILTLPAAIAILVTTLKPEWGWVVGYRLVLIMFGLLIGGRL